MASAAFASANNLSVFSGGTTVRPPGPELLGERSASPALRMDLRNRGALDGALLLDACNKFQRHSISGRVIASISPCISSNAPHLISDSISSRSTGTRHRKSSSERNSPPSPRVCRMAVIVSIRSPRTCINPTRSARFPSPSSSAVYSIRE